MPLQAEPFNLPDLKKDDHAPVAELTAFEKKLFSIDQRLLSKEWRLKNLYWIRTRDGELIKFKPNPMQDFFLRNRHSRELILKIRQVGSSTVVSLDMLDDCLFIPQLLTAVVADKEKNAKNIFDRVEEAWRFFPQGLKDALGLSCDSDSATLLSWSNGSSYRASTTLHSGTYQRLHVSEYGPLCAQSPEKASDLKKSAFPTVSERGRLTVESTAEGEGNDFHDMWVDAYTRSLRRTDAPLHPLEFKPFFFPWYIHPEYQTSTQGVSVDVNTNLYLDRLSTDLKIDLSKEQRAWYFLKKLEMKERMMEQYPSTADEAFLASGDRLFNAEIVSKKIKEEVRLPIETMLNGRLLIYRHFELRHRYVLGADPSQGIGRDSATAAVIDVTSCEVVATFEDPNIAPTELGDIIAYIGHLYGTCLVAPESNNHGHATLARLVDIGYPNIYHFVLRGVLDEEETKRLGWLTTQTTKPRMFFELSDAFSDPHQPLIVPDEPTLKEALYYRKEETNIISPLSMKRLSRHFDRLTSLAIAWQVRSSATDPVAKQRKDSLILEARRKRNRLFH